MNDDIVRTIKAPNVMEHRFHIMAVNIWMEDESTGDIIPAEIALVEMSLKNGVTRKYIQLIDPGEVPAGFKSDLKLNSDKYHDIWIDNPELTDSYGDILDAVVDILKVRKNERFGGQNMTFNTSHNISQPEGIQCANTHKLLPVYVMPSEKKTISGAMNWLTRQANKDVTLIFYDLEFMFQQLVAASPSDSQTKLSLGAAEAYLTRDIFLYMSSVSCK